MASTWIEVDVGASGADHAPLLKNLITRLAQTKDALDLVVGKMNAMETPGIIETQFGLPADKGATVLAGLEGLQTAMNGATPNTVTAIINNLG